MGGQEDDEAPIKSRSGSVCFSESSGVLVALGRLRPPTATAGAALLQYRSERVSSDDWCRQAGLVRLARVIVRNSADTATATRIPIVVTPMFAALRSFVFASAVLASVDTMGDPRSRRVEGASAG